MRTITHSSKDTSLQTLIERRVERILTPLESFVRKQAAAGVLLIIAALLALFLANSPWHEWVVHIAALELGAYPLHPTRFKMIPLMFKTSVEIVICLNLF